MKLNFLPSLRNNQDVIMMIRVPIAKLIPTDNAIVSGGTVSGGTLI
jgi:hypothetical protein